MIAVALALITREFGIGVSDASWLISGFYIAAAIAQPLMGRLADRFGARRVFSAGLVIVGLTGLLAPFVPGFGWLVVLRAAQAAGTSAAFPAGLALIRASTSDPRGHAPAAALGAVSVASSASAALGPVIGGFLVAAAGWPAIFVVNVPVTAAGLALALRWIPPDAPWDDRMEGGAKTVLRDLDPAGVALFAIALVGLLGFLLSLSGSPAYALVPVAVAAGALLIVREWRTEAPFLDVRMLASNRRLDWVYAQFAAVNVVFYSVFFSLPLWLERAHGFGSEQAGLMMLPMAGIGVFVTPLAARIAGRFGSRPALVVGATALLAGSLLLLVFRPSTPVPAILAVGAVLGVPNGFNNLGLQTALYEAAPGEAMGAASGLFQTFRYVGAILSTSLLGVLFGQRVDTSGLHQIAVVISVISALLVVASLGFGKTPARHHSG